MIINKMKIPLYGIFIILSLIIGLIYILIFLKNKKIKTNDILLYFFVMIPFVIVGGKTMSILIEGNNANMLTAGLSSYGGAVGMILIAVIYEKINPSNNLFLKSSILALPLIYSVSKLGCFFAGCCYGIPYNGLLFVKYSDGLNIELFPIQLVESIVFFMIFVIINLLEKKNTKNLISKTIIICATLKFLLDFLRYNHTYEFISFNQIVSIIFIAYGILSIYKKGKII